MKMLSIFVGFFVLINFSNAQAQSDLKQNVQLMNSDYSLVSADLDQNRFSAQNVLISLQNVSESTLDLKIVNNICPKIPGKFSCMAMPVPLFIGEFKLGPISVDGCGVRTQVSEVQLQNGDLAQLEVKNFRQMTCEIVYIADLEITLSLKNDGLESVSKLLLNQKGIANLPFTQPPFLINPIAEQQFVSEGAPELVGSFFDGRADVSAKIELNRKDKKVDLTITHNPCANLPCEAIQGDLIRKTLIIYSVKSNKCNEKTYYTNETSVYDAYPAVVGAVHTYVSLEIHDTRYSVCNRSYSVTAVVKVTERQNLVQDVVIGESTATFQLFKVEDAK